MSGPAADTAVGFLTEEYLAGLAQLQARDQQPIPHVNVRLQFHVNDPPEGAADYFVLIEKGVCVRAGRGRLDDGDLEISATYRTLVNFHTGELHAATAFVTGQFAVTGDKAKLLELMLVLQTGYYHQFIADLWDRTAVARDHRRSSND